MPAILETDHFRVEGHDKPHHDRNNGGHMVIAPKEHFVHRTELPLDLATELMVLTMIVGEAVMNVMRAKGIQIVRINYQDNGNWAYKPNMPKNPRLHIHLYARSENEHHPQNDPRFQAFPEALVFPPNDDGTGYYDSFIPYTEEDCADLRIEINRIAQTDKYQGHVQGLPVKGD